MLAIVVNISSSHIRMISPGLFVVTSLCDTEAYFYEPAVQDKIILCADVISCHFDSSRNAYYKDTRITTAIHCHSSDTLYIDI